MNGVIKLEGGVELIDLALFVRSRRALAIADIHLGYEETLRREGTLLPRGHFTRLIARLEEIMGRLGVSTREPLEHLIINGDLTHPFDYLPVGEGSELRALLKLLEGISHKIVILEGNHDRSLSLNMLSEEYERVQIRDFYELAEVLFFHGDREPETLPSGVKTLAIGHEHPAVGLRDRVTGRVELFKCFLVGEYRGRRLIVQPSFNPLVEGSDLTRERCLSPLLSEEALGKFEVYPVSDRGAVYHFGRLEGLMETRRVTWSAS